jgi:magnesium-transporting ATPase (P-type)
VPPSGGLAYQQTVEQVLAHTQSQASGLDRAEAQARLQKQGRMRCRRKRQTAWLRFLAHFNDVLIYVLLAAAVLTAVMGHWVDTLVILGVAVINA